jgi:serine/threonine protein kinase/tetratricopeptide (TPR) repeat protein
MANVISQRYQIKASLGRGALGECLHVVDVGSSAVTPDELLLKRFAVPAERLTRHLKTPGAEALIHLLDELSQINHPHLVPVQHYGVDVTQSTPAIYYTRALLPTFQTILTAGRTFPLEGQLWLMAQVLSVLVYLHRRGLLHRSLKPENVCVLDGQAQVLDAGLSLSSTGGDLNRWPLESLAYLAPEQIEGKPASAQTDLYACGLLLYELVTGRFPYQRSTRRELITNIQMFTPPLTADGVPTAVMELIAQLIDKNPAQRFASAQAALAALEAIIGAPLELVSPFNSFPYLPTPRLFGRDVELAQIDSLLNALQQGSGGALFFNGPSGMGKTALLHEAQRRAATRTISTLRLRPEVDHGGPWSLWRALIRCMALAEQATPSDQQVLRQMLGAAEADAQPLAADALLATFNHLLPTLATTQPLLLLLDDLHHASADSLWLLEQILPLTQVCPLVIIGAFDAERAPSLALPATVLLRRLSVRSISGISQQLLGSAGELPIVNALLFRETEGNPFFLMEVIRALAELTGDLAEIGIKTLPDQLFPEGLTEALNRRLALLDEPLLELLCLMALDSDLFDLSLLAKLTDPTTARRLLLHAHDASVLAVDAGRWRFAHPLLHAACRALLDETQREAVHLRLAALLEELQAAPERIAYHFQQAGHDELAYPFTLRAAEAAFIGGAPEYTVAALERLLPATEASAERARLLLMLGEAYLQLGDEARAEPRLTEALSRTSVAAERARCLLGLATCARLRDDSSEAQRLLREAAASPHAPSQALALLGLGNLTGEAGDVAAAVAYSEQALASGGLNTLQRVRTLQALGLTYADLGELPRAVERLAQAVELASTVDTREYARALTSLAGVYFVRGGYDEARACFIQRLALAVEQQDRANSARVLGNLGRISTLTGQHAQAERLLVQGLRLAIDSPLAEAGIAFNLGLHYTATGQHALALTAFETAARAAQASGSPTLEAQAALYRIVAQVQLGQRTRDEAIRALTELAVASDDPITQALIDYWRWKLDPAQAEAAQRAAAIYAEAYALTQDIEMNQRHEELTGQRLPMPALPPLPAAVNARAVDLEALLAALNGLLPS